MLIWLTGCKENPKSNVLPIDTDEVTAIPQTTNEHRGKLLMEQECYGCHAPEATSDTRIAPPMEAIKRHYLDTNVTKAEFTNAFTKWVNDPEAETKIPMAHKRFGPMPYMPIPASEIALIADYIYENELERPEGFDIRFEQAHERGKDMRACRCFEYPEPEEVYAEIGLAYVKEAKSILVKELTGAIEEQGTVGAIAFCHTEATRLTDSISLMKNAIVERVSDKPRNPNNLANEKEKKYIASFEERVAAGAEIDPIVLSDKGEVSTYYPILTNALCLQCHGVPNEQIQANTVAALRKLYPDDLAIGYDVNEVRGMWRVVFDSNR